MGSEMCIRDSLACNIGIVVTGAAVRLTGSGLGCPTWPRCSDESYVAHGELGINGAIEFGNRLLTFVLAAVALLCFLAAVAAARRRAIRLSLVIGLGIPAQALIGGVTVLTDLNPWVVAGHFLVSMFIIMVCIALLDDLRSPTRGLAPMPQRGLASPAWLPGGWCSTSARWSRVLDRTLATRTRGATGSTRPSFHRHTPSRSTCWSR